MYLKNLSSRYTNQQNHTDLLVSFLAYRRETNKPMIILMVLFIYWKSILANLLKQDTSEISLAWQKYTTKTVSFSSHITPQITSNIHSGNLSVDPLSLKKSRYEKLYYIIWMWTKTILYSLFWRINNIGLFELHCILTVLERYIY